MKIKLCLLISLLFSIQTSVFANAIVERKFPQKRTAIQSSTYNFKNVEQSSHNINLLEPAIKELKEKISINPTNYTLTANLIDLYIKTDEYEKAFEELIYLSNLDNQNRLNQDTKSVINNTYKNTKTNISYTNNKTFLYANISMLALLSGNIIDARNYIVKASTINPNDELLTKAIKQIYLKTEDETAAINECNRIINKNQNSIYARKLKAELLEASNQKELAIKEYITIVGLDIKDNDIKYKLYKLLEAKSYNAKEIVATIYSSTQTNIETAYYDIANILLDNDEINPARYYAEYLAKSTNNKAQGYSLLSEIYRKQGNLQESYKALNEVKNNVSSKEEIREYNIQKAKLSNNPIEEARSLIKQNLFEQALTILNTLDQNDLDVLILSSISNSALNNKQEALNILNKTMSLYPNNERVYACFSSLYLKESDFESAKKYLNEALKISPTNKDIINLEKMIKDKEAEAFLSKIISAYEMQNYTEAERLTDEALKISKDVADLNYYKGALLISQNKYAESTAYLYKCIELNKKHYLAYFYLGISFDNLSEQENALINYKKFVQLIPSDLYEENEKINYAKTRIEKLQKHN